MKRVAVAITFALAACCFGAGLQAHGAVVQRAFAAPSGKPTPSQIVRRVQRQWRAALTAGALADPRTHFPAPPFSVLGARLATVQKKYGFGWLYVTTFQPRQTVPLVTFKTSKEKAFARAAPAILRSLDPKRNTGDDRTGWAYEGFFLKAVDEKGTPFLIVYNHFRGPHAGGGQWASRKELLPFPHG